MISDPQCDNLTISVSAVRVPASTAQDLIVTFSPVSGKNGNEQVLTRFNVELRVEYVVLNELCLLYIEFKAL